MSALVSFGPPFFAWMADLGPNGAVLLATAGLLLIFLELNRPGLVLPGAVGLLAILLAAAAISRYPLQGWALTLLALAFATLLCNVWLKLPLWLLSLCAIAMVVALHFLLQTNAASEVTWSVATLSGLVVGVLGSFLSRVALRARRAKAVH